MERSPTRRRIEQIADMLEGLSRNQNNRMINRVTIMGIETDKKIRKKRKKLSRIKDSFWASVNMQEQKQKL